MQKVHCHNQEYWVVTHTRCKCGTKYVKASVGAQRLEDRATGPVDVIVVRCENCGEERELEFDISSFFGKVDAFSFQELLNDRERTWQMYVWHQLRMEAVLKYLSELAEARDSLAIEYIASAARHFLEKSQTEPDAGPG